MTDWYYLADRKRRGPVALDVVLAHIRSQPTPHEVQVTHKGLKGWVPALDVPELARVLPSLPPGYKRPKYKSRVGLGLRDPTEDTIFFVALGVTAGVMLLTGRYGLVDGFLAGALNGVIAIAVSRLFRRKR